MSEAVTIVGNPISLWFYVQGSTSIFQITIGTNNNVYQLKRKVKEAREPEFDTFAPDRIKLLKLKSPVGDGQISDIGNFTLQDDEEENDNVILMKNMQKIVTYWPEDQAPPEDLIHGIVEAPDLADQPVAASSSNKRQREDHIITTEGPLHPHQGALMLPIRERGIFQVVKSGFWGGKSFIIHGPYQSGKSTFLLELRETLRHERLAYVHFSMPSIKGATLTNKREGFFRHMSYTLFGKTLDETATFAHIFKLEDPLYLLIDEFQYIFTSSELCEVAKHFFREISSAKVHYVAVGTFILVDLMKSEEELISPFNKAKFEKMPLFSTDEMTQLFESYKLNINEKGVQPVLQAEIVKESCGHPASFMILLKLFHDNLPDITHWGQVLQENLEECMNGTHTTLKHEIIKMGIDEKKYIRNLTEHMADSWKMDLSDLTALNDQDKKLLDIGIIYPVDSNLVCFTSCIILRVCIHALFPTPSSSISKDEVPDNPADLLALGLGSIDPIIVSDKRSKNLRSVSERVMQASLFCTFNGLLPRPMMCLLEMKAEGQSQLDLMIVNSNQNHVAYSLKSDKLSQADFKKPIEQAQGYATHYEMDVHLVNFFPSGHNLRSNINIPRGIILINVEHNDSCTRFTITMPSDPNYSKVVNVNRNS